MLLALIPSIALRAATVVASAQPGAVAHVAASAPSAAPAPAPAPATVTATLYDVNHGDRVELALPLDGQVDDATAARLRHLLRCKRSQKEHAIKPATLAMLAAVAQRYPGRTIELVSAYREAAKDSKGSKHRLGAAIDFRVLGESMVEVRDWLWRSYKGVGIGWYPVEGFVHMDSRPDEVDMSWTFTRGSNHYHPEWARRAREADAGKAVRQRGAGV